MSEVAQTPQLRFPEFDGDWESNNLNEISDLITKGTTPTSVGFEFTQEGVNFIKVESIENHSIDIDSTPKVSLECHNHLSRSQLHIGDIVFSIAGTIGRTAIVSNKDLPANTNQALSIVRLKKGKVIGFIHYLLNLEKIKKYSYSTLSVGAQPNLSLQQVGAIKLNLPTKSEQQKIAAFLTVVDNKIEQLSKKQELLKEYKKGLMQQIFSQAIRFSPKGTSSQAQGEIDDGSEFADWQEKKLGDVLKRTSTGLNPRQNFKLGYGENYYVTIKNISNGKLDFSKCEMIDNDAMAMIANRSDLSKDDLIMSSIGNVGESYLLDKEPQNWNINESVFMLRASKLILPQFLYFIITNEQSKWYLESNSTGSSFKSIKLGELKLLPLRLPSLEEQTKIANFLSSIDRKIEQVGAQLDKSKQFKKALLQQMFV